MKYAFIDRERDSYPLSLLCAGLEVSRGTYGVARIMRERDIAGRAKHT